MRELKVKEPQGGIRQGAYLQYHIKGVKVMIVLAVK